MSLSDSVLLVIDILGSCWAVHYLVEQVAELQVTKRSSNRGIKQSGEIIQKASPFIVQL